MYAYVHSLQSFLCVQLRGCKQLCVQLHPLMLVWCFDKQPPLACMYVCVNCAMSHTHIMDDIHVVITFVTFVCARACMYAWLLFMCAPFSALFISIEMYVHACVHDTCMCVMFTPCTAWHMYHTCTCIPHRLQLTCHMRHTRACGMHVLYVCVCIHSYTHVHMYTHYFSLTCSVSVCMAPMYTCIHICTCMRL